MTLLITQTPISFQFVGGQNSFSEKRNSRKGVFLRNGEIARYMINGVIKIKMCYGFSNKLGVDGRE